MVDRTARGITQTAIARHFMVHDGKATGRNDGLCQQCPLERYPMGKRLKYAPGPLYTATYHRLCSTLEDLIIEGEELNMKRLEHLAEKMIHEWLRQRDNDYISRSGALGIKQVSTACNNGRRNRFNM